MSDGESPGRGNRQHLDEYGHDIDIYEQLELILGDVEEDNEEEDEDYEDVSAYSSDDEDLYDYDDIDPDHESWLGAAHVWSAKCHKQSTYEEQKQPYSLLNLLWKSQCKELWSIAGSQLQKG